MNKELRKDVKAALVSALPVVIGYLPIAIAFGLLAKNTGVSFRDTGLFSLIIYAGASQFMALDLIQAGVATSSIILATFLLNLRHVVMSASLSLNLKDVKKIYLPIIAFGITDETFSVLSFNKDKLNSTYVLVITILSFISWVLGSLLGYLVGEILPQAVQSSLGIGLYAMFAALLFPSFRNEKKNLYLSIIAAILYAVIYKAKIFSAGWDIVIGIIISSALGVFIFTKVEKEEDFN